MNWDFIKELLWKVFWSVIAPILLSTTSDVIKDVQASVAAVNERTDLTGVEKRVLVIESLSNSAEKYKDVPTKTLNGLLEFAVIQLGQNK